MGQTFTLDVDALDVRFPADPCRGQDASAPCGQEPVPRLDEVSFQFTGNIPFRLTFELDWLTLEPKDQPGLAWRPVLLAHGWRGGPDDRACPTPSRADPPGASASPPGMWASPATTQAYRLEDFAESPRFTVGARSRV